VRIGYAHGTCVWEALRETARRTAAAVEMALDV